MGHLSSRNRMGGREVFQFWCYNSLIRACVSVVLAAGYLYHSLPLLRSSEAQYPPLFSRYHLD
jgi:hypothetical protein